MRPVRYAHVWPGVLLLASLAFLLGILLGWGDHVLSPGPPGGIGRLLQMGSASRVTDDIALALTHGYAAGLDGDGRRASSGADQRSVAIGGHPAAPESPGDRTGAEPPSAAHLPEPSATPAAPRRSSARYALDLGSFALIEDAERAEVRLNEAGFSTVRFRQQPPVRLFSVVTTSAAEEADAVLARLREEGFVHAALIGRGAARGIRVTGGVPLRTAVRTAERLRAAGHEPRVVAEVARTGPITLRHGNFTSREEAETAGRDIARLGVVYEVIEVR